MYKKRQPAKTTVNVNKSYEGERLEQKIKRILNNKEPITDGAPLIYTERKEGVLPEYDIRTDRMEIAIDAMDKVTKSKRAKREERIQTIGQQAQEGMKNEQSSANTTDSSK